MIKIRGNTPEEKFKSVEIALNRFARRIKPEATVYIPSIPIAFFCEDFSDGLVIGRYIFPTDGVLLKAAIYLDFSGKVQPTEIVVRAELGEELTSQSFRMRKRQALRKFEVPIEAATRFTFELAEFPEGLRSVWLGFLYRIKVADAEVRKVTLGKLEAIDERADQEA